MDTSAALYLPPFRLGVGFLDCPTLIKGRRRGQNAIIYLILQQNLRQNSFQFSVTDLNLMAQRVVESRDDYGAIFGEAVTSGVIRAKTDENYYQRTGLHQQDSMEFLNRAKAAASLAGQVVEHDFGTSRVDTKVPQKWIVFTETPFEEYVVSRSDNDMYVVSLADWNRFIAPPTIAEFSLAVTQAACLKLFFGMTEHYVTRGCILDFDEYIEDFRFSTLGGICGECDAILDEKLKHDPPSKNAFNTLLDRRWLGSLSESGSVVSVAKKAFNYDIYLSKGLTPNKWEVLLDRFTGDWLDEVLKLVFALALAYLLLRFGLRP